jgi:meiotically up-regulated gene 157 (Mug157) protein
VQAPCTRRSQIPQPAVDAFIVSTSDKIGDPMLAAMFQNCFPNTLHTTVQPGQFDGRPDTAVLTGDIDAMWLRDSSAQVWPYLPLTAWSEAIATLMCEAFGKVDEEHSVRLVTQKLPAQKTSSHDEDQE